MTTAARTTLRDLISAQGCALFDGAMGTMLQGRVSRRASPASAGTSIAPTPSPRSIAATAPRAPCWSRRTPFGASAPRLAAVGLEDRVAEVNAAAVRIARTVADEFGALVAGDVGPTGELIEPLGTLSAHDAQAVFEEQIEALATAGADLILAETMSDLAEAEAVVRAAHEAAPDLEVAVTLSFDTNRHTMMGVSPAQAVATLADLGVTAVGANCGRGISDMVAVMSMTRNDPVCHQPRVGSAR